MAKHLNVSFPQKCTGCELCVLEIQRQLKKVGLEGSLIRIFKNRDEESGFLKFSVDLDPRIHSFNLEKIRTICPTLVFEILEEDGHELIE